MLVSGWQHLLIEPADGEDDVAIGKEPHIVASRDDGPRGANTLSTDERQRWASLVNNRGAPIVKLAPFHTTDSLLRAEIDLGLNGISAVCRFSERHLFGFPSCGQILHLVDAHFVAGSA